MTPPWFVDAADLPISNHLGCSLSHDRVATLPKREPKHDLAEAVYSRAIRAVARAPIQLYRAGLGCLLGHRILLLEHVGRHSGLPRYAVLEVVGRPAPDRYVVAAGLGERAQWLRNVRAEPQVRVSVGRLARVPAVARVLSKAEAVAVLRRYGIEHPWAWRLVRPVLRWAARGRIPLDGPERIAERIPLVELALVR